MVLKEPIIPPKGKTIPSETIPKESLARNDRLSAFARNGFSPT
jgi:hypothetical protein